jgi:DNA-binding NarL/FixJ family response regulator
MPFRLLIADDSSVLRNALRGLFNGLGDYQILEAVTGRDAVSKAEEFKPDLIILDFAMPEMDGLNASRLLQKRLPEIPIVMFTMHYTEQLCTVAQSAGVRTIVSKSETSHLIAAVRDLLTPASSKTRPKAARAAAKSQAVFPVPATQSGS